MLRQVVVGVIALLLVSAAPGHAPAGELADLNFAGTDVLEVVRWFSERTGRNFILDEKVKGDKITILSSAPVDMETAFQAFLSALEINGLTITRIGPYWRLRKIKDARSEVGGMLREGQPVPDSDQMVTFVYRVKHLQLSDIDKVVNAFQTPNATSLPFEPSSALIMVDTAANVNRILHLLEQLDRPGLGENLFMIRIVYAEAREIADRLNQIFGSGGKPGAAASPTAQTISAIVADERSNSIVFVSQPGLVEKISRLVRSLDIPMATNQKLHVIYLRNAAAEDLATVIQSLVTGAGAQRGKKGQPGGQALFEGEVKVTADKATNSLLVIASLNDLAKLKGVVEKLDIKKEQVFIEVMIMEVKVGDTSDVGLAMNYGRTVTIDGKKIPIFGGTSFGTLNSVLLDPQALMGIALGLRGPDLEGSTGLLAPGVSIPSIGVVMKALQQNDNFNVVSSPHLLTTDNEEAEIVVGMNVPFITGQARDSLNQPVLSIQRQDVALSMKVKPQIQQGDYLQMKIEQELTELSAFSETLGPTTSKRAAKTTVVIKDRQTIVLGGLMRDSEIKDVSKVPLLGDIPLLGRLFSRDKTVKEKVNLLVFVTPYIVRDREDFRTIFKQKLAERRQFMEQEGMTDRYADEVVYERKVGMVEAIRQGIETERVQAAELDQIRQNVLRLERESRVETLGQAEPGAGVDLPSGGEMPALDSPPQEMPPEPVPEAPPEQPPEAVAPIAPM